MKKDKLLRGFENNLLKYKMSNSYFSKFKFKQFSYGVWKRFMKFKEFEKQIFALSEISKAIVFYCFLENFFSKLAQIEISKGKEIITRNEKWSMSSNLRDATRRIFFVRRN